MKKVFLLATVFAALTFTSCGGGKEEATESDSTAVTEDTTATEDVVEEPVDDTTATEGDTTVAE
ncbi:MAG TPA: hypothetical protein VK177_03820 [Flavobacteriales bacterium]|nr:hypothetical protein [Flavobacteriales bacterium]